MEVAHVKARRTKKEKRKNDTKGSSPKVTRRLLAKAGAMMDDGFMAEARAETVKKEREEEYAALQYAASFRCLVRE